MESQNEIREKSKKRRPRSATGERNYGCGCGKAYLSYPALYTHVKNKHKSVFPIGSNSKRRIPRQIDNELEELFKRDIENFYKKIDEYFSQIESAHSLSEKKTEIILDKEYIEGLFNYKFMKNDENLLLFKKSLLKVLEFVSDCDNFVKNENLSLNDVLAFYILSVYSYCSQNFFKEYFFLIVMIIKSLNKLGNIFKISDKESLNGHFCETKDIGIVLKLMNLFLAELFPFFFREFVKDFEFVYLGFEEENIKNLILMTKFITNWLYHCRFVDYKLEINCDF